MVTSTRRLGPAMMNLSVDVEVEVDEVLGELDEADLVAACRDRGFVLLSRTDVDDLALRLRLRDREGALLVLERLLPRSVDLRRTLGPLFESARPC